jgi:hypothetical protein
MIFAPWECNLLKLLQPLAWISTERNSPKN